MSKGTGRWAGTRRGRVVGRGPARVWGKGQAERQVKSREAALAFQARGPEGVGSQWEPPRCLWLLWRQWFTTVILYTRERSGGSPFEASRANSLGDAYLEKTLCGVGPEFKPCTAHKKNSDSSSGPSSQTE
jgi:hypothetical protein